MQYRTDSIATSSYKKKKHFWKIVYKWFLMVPVNLLDKSSWTTTQPIWPWLGAVDELWLSPTRWIKVVIDETKKHELCLKLDVRNSNWRCSVWFITCWTVHEAWMLPLLKSVSIIVIDGIFLVSTRRRWRRRTAPIEGELDCPCTIQFVYSFHDFTREKYKDRACCMDPKNS